MSRIHQASDFVVSELSGKTVERIIADYEDSPDCADRLFLQVGDEWHCCFLDAGLGFWELGYPPWQDSLQEADLGEEFGIPLPQVIESVRCVGSTITILLSLGDTLVLAFQSTDVLDDHCYLTYARVVPD